MISVVVCTRNRAPRLERCLLHLSRMSHEPELEWELVVVDNGSSDDTKAVIDRFAASLPVTYVFEGSRGLSQARNRGIVASRYPIIAFTDDDCLVRQDWLAAIVNAFACDPELSILGGRVELADSGDYPVANRLHDGPENVTAIEQVMALLIGCNMAFRRDVFDTVGLFDTVFGKGTPIGSAEDIDLFYRALRHGRRIAYSPGVVVYHAHGRSAPASLESVTRDYVRGRGAFYWKFIGDRPILRMAYWEVRGLLKDCTHVPGQKTSSAVLRNLAAGALYKCFGVVASDAARARHRLTS